MHNNTTFSPNFLGLTLLLPLQTLCSIQRCFQSAKPNLGAICEQYVLHLENGDGNGVMCGEYTSSGHKPGARKY